MTQTKNNLNNCSLTNSVAKYQATTSPICYKQFQTTESQVQQKRREVEPLSGGRLPGLERIRKNTTVSGLCIGCIVLPSQAMDRDATAVSETDTHFHG